MAAIHVRPATPADTALIFDFVAELAAYEDLSDAVVATPATLASALFAEQPRAFCDIAELAGDPVGFTVWFYSFSTFRSRHGIWLEDLFVRPPSRGRGVGKALLARLAERCVHEDLGRLEWSVLDWNETAIGFYRALGAEMMDQWTNCRLEAEALQRLGSLPGSRAE